MKFTDSQKDFILSTLTTEITNKEIYIKYLTDKAEKENNIEIKKYKPPNHWDVDLHSNKLLSRCFILSNTENPVAVNPDIASK